ncbi:MAG: hypothetical protein RL215_2866, partial [Planctomycetota bacterium]
IISQFTERVKELSVGWVLQRQ